MRDSPNCRAKAKVRVPRRRTEINRCIQGGQAVVNPFPISSDYFFCSLQPSQTPFCSFLQGDSERVLPPFAPSRLPSLPTPLDRHYLQRVCHHEFQIILIQNTTFLRSTPSPASFHSKHTTLPHTPIPFSLFPFTMTVIDGSDASQTEGEGPDSSDKPPHKAFKSAQKPMSNKLVLDPVKTALLGDTLLMTNDLTGVRLHSPEAGSYPKEPGHTRLTLEKLVLVDPPYNNHRSTSTLGSAPSSVVESSSPSESECTSALSSRPPSQAPSRRQSRAPSLSSG